MDIVIYWIYVVILLSLSIFPHLHIRHTQFIGYSDTVYNGYSDIAGGINFTAKLSL